MAWACANLIWVGEGWQVGGGGAWEGEGMAGSVQVRWYLIGDGLLGEWMRLWRERVVPLRRECGFRVGAAWVDRERNEFIWVLSYEGREGAEEAERRYRAAARDLDTGRYVRERRVQVVEQEDVRFRAAAEVRHSARGLLLDGDDLLLWERRVPGRPRYWVTPGGGVEEGDAGLEATLRRELKEELGATVGAAMEVFVSRHEEVTMTQVAHFFVCKLKTLDLGLQSGPEFGDPAQGEHRLARIPFTPEGLEGIELLPVELADYLKTNAGTIRRLAELVDGSPQA